MEESHDGQKIWDDANGAKLRSLVDNLDAHDHRLILRAKHTVSWMTIRGTIVNSTVLAATTFRGFVCSRRCYHT